MTQIGESEPARSLSEPLVVSIRVARSGVTVTTIRVRLLRVMRRRCCTRLLPACSTGARARVCVCVCVCVCGRRIRVTWRRCATWPTSPPCSTTSPRSRPLCHAPSPLHPSQGHSSRPPSPPPAPTSDSPGTAGPRPAVRRAAGTGACGAAALRASRAGLAGLGPCGPLARDHPAGIRVRYRGRYPSQIPGRYPSQVPGPVSESGTGAGIRVRYRGRYPSQVPGPVSGLWAARAAARGAYAG